MSPKFLTFKLANGCNKDALSIRKRLLRRANNNRDKDLQHFQKNSVYLKTFYLNSFLLLTSTSFQNLYHCITWNRCRNCYTLNTNSYLHWRGIGTYLYSQLMKLLLISRNMNYPRKNLIYLKQVYTFQSNHTKFHNPKSSLSLKRFILNNLKSKGTKSQIKAHLSHLANSYF